MPILWLVMVWVEEEGGAEASVEEVEDGAEAAGGVAEGGDLNCPRKNWMHSLIRIWLIRRLYLIRIWMII